MVRKQHSWRDCWLPLQKRECGSYYPGTWRQQRWEMRCAAFYSIPNIEIVPLTEALLYAASRAQLVQEVIKPALTAGKLVLCDRFIDSSLAYQVYGGGLDFDFVWRTNLAAVDGCLPDKTFVLNIEPQVGLARRGAAAADRMEQKPLAFHQRVQQGFLQLAERFPERLTVVEADRPADEVFAEIWRQAAPHVAALR